MAEKAKIQYVGQFYIHGAAAPQVEPRRIRNLPRTTLPLFRPNRKPVYRVNPVAVASMVMGLVLAVTMLCGLVQIQEDWEDYNRMATRREELRADNAELNRQFWKAYDMEEVERMALGLGMIPESEAKHITVTITPTVHEEKIEPTITEKLVWFWKGLWE